jgi:hypothetical protein
VICVWGSAQPNVTQYRFELASDSLFGSVIVDSTLSDTTLIVRGLVNSNSYWWRVRAENVAGPGAFSTAWKFQVIITGVDDENGLPTEFVVRQNYPNPFNPTTTIRAVFNGQAPADAGGIGVSIYRVDGSLVRRVTGGAISGNEFSVRWDGRDERGNAAPAGVYFYAVRAAGIGSTGKMILAR